MASVMVMKQHEGLDNTCGKSWRFTSAIVIRVPLAILCCCIEQCIDYCTTIEYVSLLVEDEDLSLSLSRERELNIMYSADHKNHKQLDTPC